MNRPTLDRSATRIWFPWQPGPEQNTREPVIVSLTDYTMHSLRSFPGIFRAGRRLQLAWYGIPGAVGVYLWADPVRRRTGSVSVWTDRAAMRRWVRLPLHVKIMRRYRGRGTLQSTIWQHERFDRKQVLAQATRRLDSGDYD